MPYLEIKECVSCPYSVTSNYDKDRNYVGDDMFHIKCDHELQSNTDGFVAKIKNKHNHIYFNCPLSEPE